jgi:hypothetical protein
MRDLDAEIVGKRRLLEFAHDRSLDRFLDRFLGR